MWPIDIGCLRGVHICVPSRCSLYIGSTSQSSFSRDINSGVWRYADPACRALGRHKSAGLGGSSSNLMVFSISLTISIPLLGTQERVPTRLNLVGAKAGIVMDVVRASLIFNGTLLGIQARPVYSGRGDVFVARSVA